MLKRSLLKLLLIYQRYITVLGFGSCRYYPSCSEYAKWQFEHNNPIIAFFESLLRILRCNQLFDGGIDYPILHNLTCKVQKLNTKDIKYWLVPKNSKKKSLVSSYFNKDKQKYYIIKNYEFTPSER
jgi:putative membrane protein insertion efficiency factor